MKILQENWEKIVRIASEKISRGHMVTFFQKSAILDFSKNVLKVGVPREIFKFWHENNSKKILLDAAKKILPTCKKIEFEVDGSLENLAVFQIEKILPKKINNEKKPKKNLNKIAISKYQAGLGSQFLDPDLTFDNFVVGQNCALAAAAANAITEKPGKKYSPLFIFGGVGLGKTHLLHAIGNKIAEKNSDFLITLLPTQKFVDDVVTAIRNGKSNRIREKFSNSDVFLLDDVQFLRGKERTQEILFHIFNSLQHEKKQIVFSADRSPAELENLTDRLISRFSMGMVVDISPPDLETRIAILQKFSENNKINLDPEVLEFIAENVTDSVRSLQGVFQQILANFELQKILPNKTNVTAILKKIGKDMRHKIDNSLEEENNFIKTKNLGDIVEKTAEFFEVAPEKILSSSRLREFVVPRQVAMYFSRKKLNFPLQKIGNFFGGRDQSSVLAAVRRVEKMRKISKNFWRETNELRKTLGF